MELLKIGDWVKGISTNDERFRGYIEAFDENGGILSVRVIQSDNEAVIGRIVKTSVRKVDLLPMVTFDREGEILNLIDTALMLKDKVWFMELTSTLNQLRQQHQEKKDEKTSSLSHPHRWRTAKDQS